MKTKIQKIRYALLTGIIVVLGFVSISNQAQASWNYSQNDESYQVVNSTPITVSITGTTPITLPNHTTTLTWTTTGSPDSCDATPNGLWSGVKSGSGGNESITDLYTVGTYTYEIICHKSGSADASAQTQVEVLPSMGVNVTLSANPTSLPYGGGSTTLTWSSTGATSCSSTDFSTGGLTSGNDTVNLTTTTTYTVTCTDGSNSAQAQAVVTVAAQQGMSVVLSASPTSMNLPSNSTTLTWVTSGSPDSCVASNGWSGNKSVAGGSEQKNNLSLGTHIYTITCMKSGYPNSVSQVNVVVNQNGCSSSCFTVSLFANASVLPYGGGTSTLTWNSLPGGVSCTSGDFNTQGNSPNGSSDVTLSSTTTYHVSCQDGSGNTALAETTVTVLNNQVVNGMCAPTHWSCSAGSSINNQTGANSWTWQCQGANGGSTASCSENFPVYECSDSADNDSDGMIDSQDPGCHTDNDPNNGASYDPTDNSEAGTGVPQCSDGIDNDGDGKIDYGNKPENDPGCSSPQDNSENNNPKPKQIEI